MSNSQKSLALSEYSEPKGFAPIIIILGIVLILGIVGGVYYFGKSPIVVTKNVMTTPPAIPTLTTTTIPKTDETANWKAYAANGYSFKYPSNLQIKDFTTSEMLNLKDSINIEAIDKSASDPLSGFNNWIYVWDNLGIQINDLATRKKWCDKLEPQLINQLECAHGDNFSVVGISGYKAYLSNGGRDNSIVRTIYIPHGNYVYEINLDDGDPKKLELQQLNNQILATFKFLDPKNSFNTQITNLIAAKWGIDPTKIKIGTPLTENADWIAVNAGIEGSGGGVAYIFQKLGGTQLELVYYGQECPSKELIANKKIPPEILIVIDSSGCGNL